MRKINTYGLVRILAILFLVIGHASYLSVGTPLGGVNWVEPANISPVYYTLAFRLLRLISAGIYRFHMPLFFMLSGAVLHLSQGNKEGGEPFHQLVTKKLKRLIIPFFIYGLLFMFPLKWLGAFYDQNTVIPAVESFLGGGESGHLWFLPALFWCFVVFYLFRHLSRLLTKSSENGSMHCLLLIFAGIVQLFYHHLGIDFFSFQKGMDHIFWFTLGYVFDGWWQKNHADMKPGKQVTWLMGLSLVVILNALVLYKYETPLLNPFFTILITSSCVFLVCSVLAKKQAVSSSGFLKMLERNCMAIYLFHDPLEYVVLRAAFEWNWLTSAWGCYLYVFLRIIGVIVISILLNEGIMLIQRLAKRRSPDISDIAKTA